MLTCWKVSPFESPCYIWWWISVWCDVDYAEAPSEVQRHELGIVCHIDDKSVVGAGDYTSLRGIN